MVEGTRAPQLATLVQRLHATPVALRRRRRRPARQPDVVAGHARARRARSHPCGRRPSCADPGRPAEALPGRGSGAVHAVAGAARPARRADRVPPPGRRHVTPRRSDLDAVTFDAMGTLVTLTDPVPRLQRALAQRLGLDVSLDRCHLAMQAEIRHYRAICHRADTPRRARGGARRVRRRARRGAPRRSRRRRGAAVPDRRDRLRRATRTSAEVLARLRARRPPDRRRLELGRLPARRARADSALAPLVDAVVTSAEARSSKPDAGHLRARGGRCSRRPAAPHAARR